MVCKGCIYWDPEFYPFNDELNGFCRLRHLKKRRYQQCMFWLNKLSVRLVNGNIKIMSKGE